MEFKYITYKCIKCNGYHRVSEYMNFLSNNLNKPIQFCSVKCYEESKHDQEGTNETTK
jgi:hypothetical protein